MDRKKIIDYLVSLGFDLEDQVFRAKAKAWSVHMFTISGIIWAALAIMALMRGDILAMWGWLALCLVVDGIDGTFARKARVTEVVPWFDGVILDSIIDYFSWTFIPALFMYQYLPWLPSGAGENWMGFLVFVTICASSMFCYCNNGMKSKDFYFVGFPAAWNIVALYLYLLQATWYANLLIVIVFVALTLSPVTFCHPFRVKKWMYLNITAVALWFMSSIYLTIVFPVLPRWVQIIWWVSGGWFMLVSLIRTYMAKPDQGDSESL